MRNQYSIFVELEGNKLEIELVLHLGLIRSTYSHYDYGDYNEFCIYNADLTSEEASFIALRFPFKVSLNKIRYEYPK